MDFSALLLYMDISCLFLIENEAQEFDEVEEVEELDPSSSDDEIDDTDFELVTEKSLEFVFNPPLYLQRYDAVIKLLSSDNWSAHMKTVVDFGCAECKFLELLIRSHKHLEHAVGVDVDRQLLESNLKRLHPLLADYLKPRTKQPLDVYLMAGSVAIEESQLRNETVDAVVAIELIEHLEEDVLSSVSSNIFGSIQPKVAIFTTPNREFNVAFPSFQGPFRHWDHKFEWNRAEFKDWATKITEMYLDYEVYFDGVGESLLYQGDIGFCSQIAVFIRKSWLNEISNPSSLSDTLVHEVSRIKDETDISALLEPCAYELVAHVVYPFRPDDRSLTQKLMEEIEYYSRYMLAAYSEAFTRKETYWADINELLNFSGIQELTENVQDIIDCVVENGRTIKTEDRTTKLMVEYIPVALSSSDDDSTFNILENCDLDQSFE